jgi:hypothetical protein
MVVVPPRNDMVVVPPRNDMVVVPPRKDKAMLHRHNICIIPHIQ